MGLGPRGSPVPLKMWSRCSWGYVRSKPAGRQGCSVEGSEGAEVGSGSAHLGVKGVEEGGMGVGGKEGRAWVGVSV